MVWRSAVQWDVMQCSDNCWVSTHRVNREFYLLTIGTQAAMEAMTPAGHHQT